MSESAGLLQAGGLRLRAWRPEEAARLLSIRERLEVVKWLGSEPKVMASISEAQQQIRVWRQRLANSAGRLGTWAVEVIDSGLVAGSLHLDELPNGNGEVEIGWVFHPDSHGMGYATTAAGSTLARAFADGLPQVVARMHVANLPSQRVCDRLGMRDCGVMPDPWYGGESRVYRISRREWSVVRLSADEQTQKLHHDHENDRP